LNEKICNLIDCFNKKDEQVLLFIEVYFKTIIREWNTIDKWRIDKFMMLMRIMLRKSFAYIESKKWNKELINSFNSLILRLPLNIDDETIPDGVCYHLSDIYLEELAKFGESLKPIRAVLMLKPFIDSLALAKKYYFVYIFLKK
jgi:ribosomal RNA-processing protein 1